MSLFSILRIITSHPLNKNNKSRAVLKFFKWQVASRLISYPIIYPFTSRCKILVARGLTGVTGNLYCGLHEFSDMGFLLHFLRMEDNFADVGANVGSYTVLASGHVGATTIALEPVPVTYNYLLQNIFLNQMHQKVEALNIAAGASNGSINFTSSFDTMNHVASSEDQNTIQVQVARLDDILAGKPVPTLMKIDVEGYETEVIKGAESTLSHSDLKAIIIELNGSGSRYGYDEAAIHHTLVHYGFKPYQYFPFQRKFTAVDTYSKHNTIYIRDLPFVEDRVRTAPKVKVSGKEF